MQIAFGLVEPFKAMKPVQSDGFGLDPIEDAEDES